MPPFIISSRLVDLGRASVTKFQGFHGIDSSTTVRVISHEAALLFTDMYCTFDSQFSRIEGSI